MISGLDVINDVRNRHLCSGCGACAFVSPTLYTIEDVETEGRRPVRLRTPGSADDRRAQQEAIAVCPGRALEHTYDDSDPELHSELAAGWGPVLGVWEGHSTDSEIRFRGSSGGAITALALYGLDAGGMTGVLHTAAQTRNPILNETVYSRSRTDLLRTAGSRYAPASPCERLDLIECEEGPSIFIGKPCDVAAVQNVGRVREQLDRKVGLTIALFCAGTPSTAGTRALLQEMRLSPSAELVHLRYRGHGWPGKATSETGSGDIRQLSYEESWGKILTRHVQWRCRLCADHTGEFADIAVGDPWYREPAEGEEGESLIVARTRRGRTFVEAAIASGYLRARPVGPHILPASQPNLLRTRGAVWGRMLACRLLRVGIPRYRRIPTFRFWIRELSLNDKLRSIFGTVRRVLQRRFAAAPPSPDSDPQNGTTSPHAR